MEKKKLILIDYSGTLSISSVRFGRSDVLTEELRQTGLADYGVTSPEIFWSDIVGPTWHEASTTGMTYAEAIRRKVRARAPGTIKDSAISDAVFRFVESYMTNSRIDPLWSPVLQKIASGFAGTAVVATDHYAEATGYIARHFGEIGIDAVPCMDSSHVGLRKHAFIIANSADMGAHKSEKKFWELLASRCAPGGVRNILLVDDFGFNEQEGDAFGMVEAVTARKMRTGQLLEEVYSAPVTVVFFGMEEDGAHGASKGQKRYERFGAWVASAKTVIEGFIKD
jgi:hypothetical protein